MSRINYQQLILNLRWLYTNAPASYLAWIMMNHREEDHRLRGEVEY